MNEVTIVYQSYIPTDLITDFSNLVQPMKIEKEEVKPGPWNHFDAPEINDIVIYISQHSTEFIVGIVGAASWDLVKSGIKFLWVGISKLPIKILHARKQTDKQKNISLRLSDKTQGIEIVFEGDVTEQQADIIIDTLKDYLCSEKANEAFYISDYIPENAKKPIIRLVYNKETKLWEPVNFGDRRRQMDELRERIRNNSCS